MSTPRPQDFASELPPERIIGTESECNIQKREGSSASKYISADAAAKAGYGIVGSFLDNGMRLYLDGEHLEIDTQECLGPRQAAAADQAAILVLRDIVKASEIEHGGVHRYSGTSIRNSQETCGYHENYLIPRTVTYSQYFDGIAISHLASRTWAMAGSLNSRLMMSQKAKGIGGDPIERQQNRRMSRGDKPMAIVPSDSNDKTTLGNSEDWARLEVRYADPGFSLTARFLTFATTSLALRLIEQEDDKEAADLAEWSFKHPVEVAKEFSGDLSFQATGETHSGKRLSALDYQEALAEQCQALSERVDLPQDEVMAIDIWFDVINKLRLVDPDAPDFKNLLTSLDFAPRFRFLSKRFSGSKLSSHNPAAAEANLSWDRILPTGGGMTYWSKMPSPYISREEVERLKTKAPETRAALRAELISDAIEEPGSSSAYWSYVSSRGLTIKLGDSYFAG